MCSVLVPHASKCKASEWLWSFPAWWYDLPQRQAFLLSQIKTLYCALVKKETMEKISEVIMVFSENINMRKIQWDYSWPYKPESVESWWSKPWACKPESVDSCQSQTSTCSCSQFLCTLHYFVLICHYCCTVLRALYLHWRCMFQFCFVMHTIGIINANCELKGVDSAAFFD
jgi:hypothetical protein